MKVVVRVGLRVYVQFDVESGLGCLAIDSSEWMQNLGIVFRVRRDGVFKRAGN
jgi:hypothetical protein